MRSRIISAIAVCLILFFGLADVSTARLQAEQRIVVPLQIKKRFGPPRPMVGIRFESGQKPKDGMMLGQARGGILIGVQALNDEQHAYRVKVDSNRDGSLEDESPLTVLPNSTIEVLVAPPIKQSRQNLLPYNLYYRRAVGKDNAVRELFAWSPNYWAQGELRLNECKALLVVTDKNEDGVFDERDFAHTPSIGLDLNGNGIVGGDEWHNGKQVLEFCGETKLIEKIEPDGSAVRLVPTSLQVARAGHPAPRFVLNTLEGKSIRSDELKGRIVLLDFWATWCQPCIENFSQVKELEEKFRSELTIITINVDEKPKLEEAKQFISRYGLKWSQAVMGDEGNETVWKVFGGIEKNGMMIPLYVLIDKSGMIRYAGYGGKGLSDLRAKLEEVAR